MQRHGLLTALGALGVRGGALAATRQLLPALASWARAYSAAEPERAAAGVRARAGRSRGGAGGRFSGRPAACGQHPPTWARNPLLPAQDASPDTFRAADLVVERSTVQQPPVNLEVWPARVGGGAVSGRRLGLT